MQNLNPRERQQIESLEEIRSNRAFRSDCGDPRLYREIDELLPPERYNEDWAGAELGRDLLDCALRLTDLGARWRIPGRKGGSEILGDFNVLHLHDVLTQEEGAPITVQNPTGFQLRFLSELRVFDHTPRSGAGKLTYLRLQRGVTAPEIWYSDIADIGGDGPYPPGYLKMDITYRQYLAALLLTKGTYGWQYLYTDMSLRRPGFAEIVGYLRGMLETFPTFFPHRDYTDLRERLDARSDST